MDVFYHTGDLSHLVSPFLLLRRTQRHRSEHLAMRERLLYHTNFCPCCRSVQRIRCLHVRNRTPVCRPGALGRLHSMLRYGCPCRGDCRYTASREGLYWQALFSVLVVQMLMKQVKLYLNLK